MYTRITILTLSAALLSLSACSSQNSDQTTSGALVGTAVGAGAGAAIGHQGGDAGTGALIGGGVGAVTGAAVGSQMGTGDKSTKDLDEVMRRQEAEKERQRREIEDLRRQQFQDRQYLDRLQGIEEKE